MSRWLYPLLLVVVATVITVITGLRFGSAGSHTSFAHIIMPTPGGPSLFHASIDADPWNGNGPCNPVDAAHAVPSGPHEVAVCIESAPASLAAFDFTVNFDPALNSCTDVSCPSGDCLDDNPDANAGLTLGSGVPTLPWLGGNWDCNPSDVVEPTCEKYGIPGKAGMACWSLTGPYTSPTGDVSFPLAVLSLTAIAEGIDSMTLENVVLGDTDIVEIGTCNPAMNVPIDCYGAEVYPPPPPTPTATPTPTRPPGVGGTIKLPPSAVAAQSNGSPNYSGWTTQGYAALAGGVAAAAIAIGGAWCVRRRCLR